MAAAQSDRDASSALCSEFLSFSAKDTAARWLAAADLQQEIYGHLATYVPRILCVGVSGGSREEQREELACQLLLLAPLEWLLLGAEPAAGLAALQENNTPSPLCGHVFKVGEPTYSCRECAADPTCVLCMQCFLGSVHKDHRYRMTTSGGGGFCDCGDAEAWKKGPYCHKHTPTSSSRDSEEDPVSLLPVDMVARGSSIFSVLLRYAVSMLTWDQEDQLPAGLEPPERGDSYYCMLFNDEVHTYEQVIYTLQKAVNCSQKEAVSFATTVDRDVRARNIYHQLLMNSLLMDLKYKKIFAIQFAKVTPDL
ncbi:E3 ubiquitin-protein ligase UBR2-like [Etheostoma cragini]|uniref:E3 ubiquitin-protein ligase UBR2-like n=1 Tax=Etheostoma cragini TaxID=417921 RepID=UPI00155EA0A9|nr:E3 ubiquitin-protein ligase UBR2-like [Etheostoma cragini]